MQKQSYQWKSQFDDKVHTLLVLYVDNKGEWMNDAIDRAHLKRKVFRQKWFCDQYFNKKKYLRAIKRPSFEGEREYFSIIDGVTRVL